MCGCLGKPGTNRHSGEKVDLGALWPGPARPPRGPMNPRLLATRRAGSATCRQDPSLECPRTPPAPEFVPATPHILKASLRAGPETHARTPPSCNLKASTVNLPIGQPFTASMLSPARTPILRARLQGQLRRSSADVDPGRGRKSAAGVVGNFGPETGPQRSDYDESWCFRRAHSFAGELVLPRRALGAAPPKQAGDRQNVFHGKESVPEAQTSLKSELCRPGSGPDPAEDISRSCPHTVPNPS